MQPKVRVFKRCAITSERASEKTDQIAKAWFDEKGENIKIYRIRAVTKKGWLGLWFITSFYVFYKDIPQ